VSIIIHYALSLPSFIYTDTATSDTYTLSLHDALPISPPGKPHRYFFKLYALKSKLDLKPGASKQEVEQAIQGSTLAKAEWMGKRSEEHTSELQSLAYLVCRLLLEKKKKNKKKNDLTK